MEKYKEAVEFKKSLSESKYQYSDEFLFEQIQLLKNEVDALKNRLDSDGR